MKRVVNILLLLCLCIGTATFTSCIPDGLDLLKNNEIPDETDEGKEGNENESEEGGEENGNKESENGIDIESLFAYVEYGNWAAMLDAMPPGIYRMGDEVVAKSTDGGAFYIEDVTDEKAHVYRGELGIPANFFATDGQKTGYFFDRAKDNWDNSINDYLETVHYVVIDESASREAFLKSSNPDLNKRGMDVIGGLYYLLQMHMDTFIHNGYTVEKTGQETIAGLVADIYTVLSSHGRLEDLYAFENGVCAKIVRYDPSDNTSKVEHCITEVDLDVGDFNETFMKLQTLYCKEPYATLAEMIPQHTRYNCGWMSDKLPSFNGKLIQYEGGGTIDKMGVIRVDDWGPHDNVSDVQFEVTGATYEDAAKYLQDMTAAIDPNWHSDENVNLGPESYDGGYIKWEMAYDPCEPTCPHDLGDVAVGYRLTLIFFGGYLNVQFSVTHTGHL